MLNELLRSDRESIAVARERRTIPVDIACKYVYIRCTPDDSRRFPSTRFRKDKRKWIGASPELLKVSKKGCGTTASDSCKFNWLPENPFSLVFNRHDDCTFYFTTTFVPATLSLPSPLLSLSLFFFSVPSDLHIEFYDRLAAGDADVETHPRSFRGWCTSCVHRMKLNQENFRETRERFELRRFSISPERTHPLSFPAQDGFAGRDSCGKYQRSFFFFTAHDLIPGLSREASRHRLSFFCMGWLRYVAALSSRVILTT